MDMDMDEYESNEATALNENAKSPTGPMEEMHKIVYKDRNLHIPYILNGELYKIQTQNGENVTVKCSNCPPDRVYRGSVRSTGNFHMHIKRRHPDLLGKLHDMKVAALLERRDRYLRNRKLSQRTFKHTNNNNNYNNNNCNTYNNNNTTIDSNANNSNGSVNSVEESIASNTDKIDSMYSHKLKIKTAFQRHQQQEAMRKSSAETCSIMPNNEHGEDEGETNEPLNFSIKKTNSGHDQQNEMQVVPSTSTDIRTPESLNDPSSSNNTRATSMDEMFCHLQCRNGNGKIANNVNEIIESTPLIVKNEPFLTNDNCAIDLTLNNSSALAAGFPGSFLGMGGIGHMQQTEQLLAQVETSLHDVQCELRTRNQIETNRLIFDIAKFKYLNPGFHFNY